MHLVECIFEKTKMSCFVVGVSGGIDSAVVSTPGTAETGKQVYVLNMPIHQKPEQEELSAAQSNGWRRNILTLQVCDLI